MRTDRTDGNIVLVTRSPLKISLSAEHRPVSSATVCTVDNSDWRRHGHGRGRRDLLIWISRTLKVKIWGNVWQYAGV